MVNKSGAKKKLKLGWWKFDFSVSSKLYYPFLICMNGNDHWSQITNQNITETKTTIWKKKSNKHTHTRFRQSQNVQMNNLKLYLIAQNSHLICHSRYYTPKQTNNSQRATNKKKYIYERIEPCVVREVKWELTMKYIYIYNTTHTKIKNSTV